MGHNTAPNPNVLWDEKTTAQFLGVSVEFLQQDRHGPKRIPFVRIGRAIRYDFADVRAFVASQKVGGAQRGPVIPWAAGVEVR
ncbi:MAG: helix-turn-helix domain-containing protein [Betaproteobacteria bacterium]|nr:helix-turn-helix domain-containing protein [Betaproteobacteria bacterium]